MLVFGCHPTWKRNMLTCRLNIVRAGIPITFPPNLLLLTFLFNYYLYHSEILSLPPLYICLCLAPLNFPRLQQFFFKTFPKINHPKHFDSFSFSFLIHNHSHSFPILFVFSSVLYDSTSSFPPCVFYVIFCMCVCVKVLAKAVYCSLLWVWLMCALIRIAGSLAFPKWKAGGWEVVFHTN